MITTAELYEVIKRDIPEVMVERGGLLSLISFDLDLNLGSARIKTKIEAVEINLGYAGIYHSSTFTSTKPPLDVGIAKLFKKRPVFLIYQQVLLYNIPTVWEIKLFFDFSDDLRSASLCFESGLIGDTSLRRNQLRKKLQMTPEFHSLIYAYLFEDTPLGILQDYIQAKVL